MDILSAYLCQGFGLASVSPSSPAEMVFPPHGRGLNPLQLNHFANTPMRVITSFKRLAIFVPLGQTVLSTTMSRVKVNLESADNFPASVFATLAQVPPSSMTAALRDSHLFSSETEARMFSLSVRLLEVVQALQPLSIRKGKWDALLSLVQSEKTADEIRVLVDALFTCGGPQD